MSLTKMSKMLVWSIGLVFLISACSTPTAAVQPASVQAGLSQVKVENVTVQIGVGSPIPVEAVVSGAWPGLCSQLAEIKQNAGDTSFEISLLATKDIPSCPPDHLGLPFRIAIPLNMVEKPAGSYTVTVNGMKTTFEWNRLSPAPATTEPTQSVTNRFTYEGVHFVLDPATAASASGQIIAEKPRSPDGPYWEVNPRYVSISLAGYPLAQTARNPDISVYPVEDYRRLSQEAGEILDQLRNLLDQQPADADKIPFLPVVNAGQVFHSNVRYLDFQSGSGVRFLTIYAQYPAPVNNQDLFYTYQGLTADGHYFVSITLPINHPSLPASLNALPASEMEAIAKDATYYSRMSAALTALPDSSFTPDLAKLDALVESLEIK